MRAGLVALSALLTVVSAPGLQAQPSAPAVRLTPHRAVYDLALLRSEGSSNIERARGRIAFDFGGDACEGYTLKYRQVTVIEGGESGGRTMDVRSATFEGADAKTLRFKTDSQTSGVSQESLDGEAELGADGKLSVRLKQPKSERVTLSGAPVFPSEHMKRLIVAARAGETSLSIKLYDGSDDGKKIYDTFAMIGRRIEPGAGPGLEEAARQDGVAKLARWPVTMSYFDTKSSDQTPAYTISFEVYENGISRALKIDYGDFALKGDLQSLAVLAETPCQR